MAGNRDNNSGSDLSKAAEKMRTGKTPQERSEGAREMGRQGGRQSHKND